MYPLWIIFFSQVAPDHCKTFLSENITLRYNTVSNLLTSNFCHHYAIIFFNGWYFFLLWYFIFPTFKKQTKLKYPLQYSKVPLGVCVPPFESHRTKQQNLLNLCQLCYFYEKKYIKWRTEVGLFSQVWCHNTYLNAVIAVSIYPAHQVRVQSAVETPKSEQGLPFQRVPFCTELYCTTLYRNGRVSALGFLQRYLAPRAETHQFLSAAVQWLTV